MLKNALMITALTFFSTALAGCHLYFGDDDRPRNDGYTYCDETGCYECDDWGCYPSDGRGEPGWTCTSNYDCAGGCFCSDDGFCEEAGFCSSDAECAAGFECDDRASCVPEGSNDVCVSDAQCPSGSYCDEQSGACVGSWAATMATLVPTNHAEWALSAMSATPVSHNPAPTTACAKKAATATKVLESASRLQPATPVDIASATSSVTKTATPAYHQMRLAQPARVLSYATLLRRSARLAQPRSSRTAATREAACSKRIAPMALHSSAATSTWTKTRVSPTPTAARSTRV